MSNARCEKIQLLLEQALSPSSLQIIDDSHKHIGHAGAASGGGHFRVIVMAEIFSGLRPIAQHQLIYKALESMMPAEIHALSIDASAH